MKVGDEVIYKTWEELEPSLNGSSTENEDEIIKRGIEVRRRSSYIIREIKGNNIILRSPSGRVHKAYSVMLKYSEPIIIL